MEDYGCDSSLLQKVGNKMNFFVTAFKKTK